MTHFAYRGVHGSTLEVIVLNGREYELAGNMVIGGKTEISFLRATVGESIDDGTIDYEKLADRFIVKQASERMNSAVHRITDPETDSGIVQHQANAVLSSGDNSARTVILSITGLLVEKTAKQFVIDWYGGGKLTIARSHAEGDWDLLKVGEWFEATVSRRMNGKVVHAMLIGTIDEPEGFSEEDLTTSYSSVPAAQLDSVK